MTPDPSHHIFLEWNDQKKLQYQNHKIRKFDLANGDCLYFLEDESSPSPLFLSDTELAWSDLQLENISLHLPIMKKPQKLYYFLLLRLDDDITSDVASRTGDAYWSDICLAISKKVGLGKKLASITPKPDKNYCLSSEEFEYFNNVLQEVHFLEEGEDIWLKEIFYKIELREKLTQEDYDFMQLHYPDLNPIQENSTEEEIQEFITEFVDQYCYSIEERCHGITGKGERCKRKVRGGSYCFQHISQAPFDSQEDEVVRKLFRQCRGITGKGKRCKRKVRGEYCYQHVSQSTSDPKDDKNRFSDSVTSVDNSSQQCRGTTKKGKRCKRKVRGEYCYQHVSQSTSDSVIYMDNYFQQCHGITGKGNRCKREVRGGPYCFQHISQAPFDSQEDEVVKKLFRQCRGITGKGKRCKRKVRGEYCYQHVSQSTSDPKDDRNRFSDFATSVDNSFQQCRGTTREGKRCKRKVRGEYCYQHAHLFTGEG